MLIICIWELTVGVLRDILQYKDYELEHSTIITNIVPIYDYSV